LKNKKTEAKSRNLIYKEAPEKTLGSPYGLQERSKATNKYSKKSGKGAKVKLILLCEITECQKGRNQRCLLYGSRAEALKGRQRISAGETSDDGGVA